MTGESARTQTAAGLLICGLQQRLFSSIEAFARTLRVHRRTVQKQWDQPRHRRHRARTEPNSWRVCRPDDERASLPEEELAAEEDALVAAVSEATRGPEAAAPESVSQGAAASRQDGGAGRLEPVPAGCPSRELDKMDSRKHVSGTRDSRKQVEQHPHDRLHRIRRHATIPLSAIKRHNRRVRPVGRPNRDLPWPNAPLTNAKRIKTAFNSDPAKNPVRILIATDAAREGLNLQAHCWNLFHFDVPWNPARMEQRNGRIDRKLQPSEVVRCHYFFYVQRPEDQVIAALVRKTKTIRKELGSLSQVD